MKDIVDMLLHHAASLEIDKGVYTDGGMAKRAADEIERLRNELLHLSAMDTVDYQNVGADLAADKLRDIAEKGRSSGVFGGAKMESAAQAVLKIYRQAQHAREAYQDALEAYQAGRRAAIDECAEFARTWGDAPPRPYGRRSQLARDMKERLNNGMANDRG